MPAFPHAPLDRPTPATCEFTVKGGRPCNKPVAYKWTPSTRPENFAWVCVWCGEGIAGNYKHELVPAAQPVSPTREASAAEAPKSSATVEAGTPQATAPSAD